MFSEKEAALRLPQLYVRFLTDSNSWNVNGTPNVRAVRQMLKRTAPELSFGNILAAKAVSAALQTPQLGGPRCHRGPKIPVPSPLSTPQKALIPQIEICSIRNK